MITGHRKFLERRAAQRGYSLEEIMGCVVAQDGDIWTADELHPSYPHPKGPPPPECLAGTELKKLLGWLRITPTSVCKCNERAAHMDAMGCQWVRDNEALVVGWLREEAEARGLPFLDSAGRRLVKLAVWKAEKRAAAAKRIS